LIRLLAEVAFRFCRSIATQCEVRTTGIGTESADRPARRAQCKSSGPDSLLDSRDPTASCRVEFFRTIANAFDKPAGFSMTKLRSFIKLRSWAGRHRISAKSLPR
jgi:hypothetical protein